MRCKVVIGGLMHAMGSPGIMLESCSLLEDWHVVFFLRESKKEICASIVKFPGPVPDQRLDLSNSM